MSGQTTTVPQRPALTRRLAEAGGFVTACTFLWLATIVWPKPAGLTLDQGWQQILVDAWINGLRFGHDLVFTWGPLGFLVNEFYLPAAIEAKLRFETLGRLAIGAVCVAVAWPMPPLRRLGWIAAIGLLGHNMFDAVSVALIPRIAAVWLLGERRIAVVALAVVTLAGLALVKFTLLTLVVAVTGVVAVTMLLDGSPGRAAGLVAAMAGAIAFWWVAAGQQLGDFVPWLRLSLEISSGYPGAMGLTPSIRVAIAGGLVAMAYAFWTSAEFWWARNNRDRLIIVGLMLGPLALAWRHGYTRADLHVHYFFLTSLLLAIVSPPTAAAGGWAGRGAAAAVLASLAAFEIVSPRMVTARVSEAWSNVWVSAQRLADQPAFAADFRRRFEAAAIDARLPEAILSRIGSDSIDLVGHSQGLLHLNGLNHRTRPVIQSYSAYTPYLAQRDRAFLASEDAPAYVIASLETIDERYPAQDDARLLAELPRLYETVGELPQGVLAHRRAAPGPPVDLGGGLLLEEDLVPGQPLELPLARDAAQWIRIEATPTPRGRLMGVVLAPPALFMTTRTDTGAEARTRVLPGLAGDGFLIQPRLLSRGDLVGLLKSKGRDWNTRITLGTGRHDAAHWQRFHVKVYRIADLPLERETLVEMGVSNVEPRRIVSAHPWEIRADGTSPRMLLHAPGEIELPVPAGARTLTGDFGIERGAYTGDGRTDGAEFVVEAITTDGRVTALWRATLSPLSNPSDRGRRHFRVELPSAPVTGVRILTRPGAAADNSWDWTYLADLRIDNQPATSTRPGTAIP